MRKTVAVMILVALTGCIAGAPEPDAKYTNETMIAKCHELGGVAQVRFGTDGRALYRGCDFPPCPAARSPEGSSR